MPKVLFYAGTVFCLFFALTSATEVVLGLPALTFADLPPTPRTQWALAATFAAGLAIAALFLRMAALLAARDLFAAFVAVLSVTGATAMLAVVLLLQWRMSEGSAGSIHELHAAALIAFGFFLALTLLSLRPYFNIQASRFLSAMVMVPLPLFFLLLVALAPAWEVFFAVLAVLFFAISVHCIRHRHLFLEMMNLRELLDSRVDPASRHGRAIGGVAFDS